MTMKDGIQMIALTFQWGTFLGKSDVDFNSESLKKTRKKYLPFDPLISCYIHPAKERTVQAHKLASQGTMLDCEAFPLL